MSTPREVRQKLLGLLTVMPYALLTFYHTRRILSIGFASFFGRPFRRPFLSCLSIRCTRTQLQGVYDPTKGKICCMASQTKISLLYNCGHISIVPYFGVLQKL